MRRWSRSVPAIALLCLAAACDEAALDFPCTYDCVTPGTAPVGDPARGRHAILNGGLVPCGIPTSVLDRIGPDFLEGVRLAEREGLNAELPYSWTATTTERGVEVFNRNCLHCHAAMFEGELVIGLSVTTNDSSDLNAPLIGLAANLVDTEAEQEEVRRAVRGAEITDRYRTDTVGVNRGATLILAYAAHRDPVHLRWRDAPYYEPPPAPPVPLDVPHWWRMNLKGAMLGNLSITGDYSPWLMNLAFACFEDVDEVNRLVSTYAADINAFLKTLAPPAWPEARHPVDEELARWGEALFEESCTKCHGSYGPAGHYPNQVIPLDVIGTDRALAESKPAWDEGWAHLQNTPFGVSDFHWRLGYAAPPLNGVWITSPFFHNGSVPTLWQVLKSSDRPRYWRRASLSGDDYDYLAVGWSHEVLPEGKDGVADAAERVRVYDTTNPGYANGGHTFGDHLSDEQRWAILEYLKTL